jgi:hypothetical protein
MHLPAWRGWGCHLEALCDVDLDALLCCASEDFLEHDVCDLLHFALGQLAEYDDLVQPVEELRPAQNCLLFYSIV